MFAPLVSKEARDEQVVFDVVCGRVERLFLPNPATLLMSGVSWGRAEAMFTPAFWTAQAWYHRESGQFTDFSWSSDLRREIVGCLLGGHGISSEMNRVAFERLNCSGLLESDWQRGEEDVFTLLRTPFVVDGRLVRYRFAAQKSRFITHALRKMESESRPDGGAVELRDWLLSFPGIGMKTASWITRNHLCTDLVAVIDIHIFRAGVIMGLYSGDEVLPRNYRCMEQKFLEFAKRIGVSACKLDVIIWRTMKDSRQIGLKSFRNAA